MYFIRDYCRKGGVLALLAMLLSPLESSASTVYAFAGQKVYDMTLTGSIPANVSGNPFSIRTSTAATLNGYPGTSSQLPVLDAAQSFLGNAVVPAENLSANAPFQGAPNPPVQQVLSQYNVTPNGVQNGTTPATPTSGDFSTSTIFTRSDVLTRIPPPAGPGDNISPGYLFDQSNAAGNVSIDSAAEGLGNLPPGAIGTAVSNWTITGSFSISNPDVIRLNFNLIDRLVSYASASGYQASSTANFSLDIVDSVTQQSVFGTTIPSSTRSLSSPLAGQATRNDNTSSITSSFAGITFQTPSQLDPGTYIFTVTGSTSINISVVPEPSSYIVMGLGVVTMGGLRIRRKLLRDKELVD